MKNFIKNRKGFTLVELVVVIAIIGILAGIAIPRFIDATETARGAKIVADMRTIQAAEIMYYAKYAKYPSNTAATTGGDANFVALIQGGWPTPPNGSFSIAKTLGTDTAGTFTAGTTATAYTYTNASAGQADPGVLTLTGGTMDGKELTELLGGTK